MIELLALYHVCMRITSNSQETSALYFKKMLINVNDIVSVINHDSECWKRFFSIESCPPFVIPDSATRVYYDTTVLLDKSPDVLGDRLTQTYMIWTTAPHPDVASLSTAFSKA